MSSTPANDSVFGAPDFADHEQVLFCSDSSVGLRAIIAIHSTALGPAAGGCRMVDYASPREALTDALRLSAAMSLKNALAGLPLGGGKAVIIADPSQPEKPELLRAFSLHVQRLAGRYWTAIDVGVSPQDVDILAERCDYVFTRASQYEEGFSAAEFTAQGGFVGIRAAAAHVWGREDLKGLRVAIQGVGATGSRLGQRLHDAGAQLVVADVSPEAVNDMVERFGAEAVDVDAIHAQDVDVFAPCALGAVVNDETLPELRARVVCGLANNQLAEPRHGRALYERGIAYVPDYVVNAGGMMGASGTIFGDTSRSRALAAIEGLYETILSILRTSHETGRASSDVADELARERIEEASRRAPERSEAPSGG